MDPVTQTHLSSLLIFFFLLLSTALVGTEGNSSSFIGHTLTRERKIQAISTKSKNRCDALIYMSYHHTVILYQHHTPLWSNLVGHVIIMNFKKFSYTDSIYFLVMRKCTCDQLMCFKFPKSDLWYKNEHNF